MQIRAYQPPRFRNRYFYLIIVNQHKIGKQTSGSDACLICHDYNNCVGAVHPITTHPYPYSWYRDPRSLIG